MILTDFYRGEKLTESKYRFDIVTSTQSYDHFESLLINKRKYNIGGLSFNLVDQPEGHSGRKADFIISKGSHSITKVFRPDIKSPAGFGDINGTSDGCIILFNSDFDKNGIITVEILVGRGCRNDKNGLINLYLEDELNEEIEELRAKAVTNLVTKNPNLKRA